MAENFGLFDRKLSRRTMLRGALAGAALPAVSALLAACGGGATPTPTTAPAAGQTPAAAESPTGEEVVLAILHFSVIEGTTWSGAHNRAGQRLAEKYPNLKYIYREQVSPDQTVPFAEEMIAQEGADIIVGNAEFIGMPLLDIVDKYPDKIFVAVTTSDLTTRPNFIRIFPRQYQSLYLEGLIAGALTKTGNVGIVSAYPNLQVLRRQAGFILGVQEAAKRLNKQVQIHIKYVGDWYLPAEERAVAETLATQYNCDVLTQQTDSGSTLDVCKARGLWFVGKDMDAVCFYQWATTDTVAISFDTRWEVIYDKIIQAYLNGQKPPEIIFPGMESKITLADGTEVTTTDIMNDCKVGIDAISPKAKAELPQEIIDLVAERREGMRTGDWDPFTEHALVSNGTGLEIEGLPIPPKGTVVKAAGEKPTDEFLLQKLNFDLDGVNILP